MSLIVNNSLGIFLFLSLLVQGVILWMILSRNPQTKGISKFSGSGFQQSMSSSSSSLKTHLIVLFVFVFVMLAISLLAPLGVN